MTPAIERVMGQVRGLQAQLDDCVKLIRWRISLIPAGRITKPLPAAYRTSAESVVADLEHETNARFEFVVTPPP